MSEAIQSLITADEAVRTATWSEFLFNPEMVKSFGRVGTVLAKQVLAAGGEWQGNGWNTSSASRKVWSLTGIALVSGNLADYLNAWLFTLALWWDPANAEKMFSFPCFPSFR